VAGATDEADKFLAGDELIRAKMARVTKLIEGFEDACGLELLSSVHWVMKGSAEAREKADAAVKAVHRWNSRKRRTLKKEPVVAAWQWLKEMNWDASLFAA
jgi:hypothetical protein